MVEGLGFEEALDCVEDSGAVFGFEDLFAERAAAGDAVGEPAGELLHLADAVTVALLAGDLACGFDSGGTSGFCGLFDGDLIDQHLEVGADHAVAVVVGGVVVGSDAGGLFGGGVLGDLAEDPWVRGSGAADHDGIAVGRVDHGGGVFGGADVAVADYRDIDCVL